VNTAQWGAAYGY